jgi:hypothetical protein
MSVGLRPIGVGSFTQVYDAEKAQCQKVSQTTRVLLIAVTAVAIVLISCVAVLAPSLIFCAIASVACCYFLIAVYIYVKHCDPTPIKDLENIFNAHKNKLSRAIKTNSNQGLAAAAEITSITFMDIKTEAGCKKVIDKTRQILCAIAETEDQNKSQRMTEIYGHCEALLIMADAMLNNRIFLNQKTSFLGEGCFNALFLFLNATEVFKPASIQRTSPEKTREIDFNRSVGVNIHNTVDRNLAVCRVAELFGHQELIVKTELTVVNGHVGIAMNKAPGETVWQTYSRNNKLGENAEFQRQCTWLQLMDCVSGHIDRHEWNLNWVWDAEHRQGSIQAFDNDTAFLDISSSRPSLAEVVPDKLGVDVVDQNNTHYAVSIDRISARNYCCPPVIDSEMREKLLNITEASLRDALEKSSLTPNQIDAACKRLKCLQAMVQDSRIVRVIHPQQWGNPSATDGLCCPDNCYFKRYTSPHK